MNYNANQFGKDDNGNEVTRELFDNASFNIVVTGVANSQRFNLENKRERNESGTYNGKPVTWLVDYDVSGTGSYRIVVTRKGGAGGSEVVITGNGSEKARKSFTGGVAMIELNAGDPSIGII